MYKTVFQKGNRVRLDPTEPYASEVEGLSLDETYVVEDVLPAENPDELPAPEAAQDEMIILQEFPDKEFEARYFVPA